jgi:hypothetical protein
MDPIVKEIALKRKYKFMYENQIIANHHELFLLVELQEKEPVNTKLIPCLKFRYSIYKFGYPNDEVGHPMMKYGLGFYGLFEVFNSPWINECMMNNRTHPSHRDEFFDKERHFIAKFKDHTFEIIASEFAEIEVEKNKLISMVEDGINSIS